MNDYRNFQRHRYNKHFSKRKHVKTKHHEKTKYISKTQIDGCEGPRVRSRAQQEFCRYIELIDNLNINNPQQHFKTNHNEYDLAFIKAIVVDKINKYSTFEYFQNIDLDIWRYIVNENFLYPHEICGTLLLINKYFNQLFDKKWLLNKLSNKQSLILYYKGLIDMVSHWKDNYPYSAVMAFGESMIEIIDKLYEMKDDLKSINSLCNCTNISDWLSMHMHHNCHHGDKLCNNKMESISKHSNASSIANSNLDTNHTTADDNSSGNYSYRVNNSSNFAGISIEIEYIRIKLKFLECICGDNGINIKDDIEIHLLPFLQEPYPYCDEALRDLIEKLFREWEGERWKVERLSMQMRNCKYSCNVLNDLHEVYQWRMDNSISSDSNVNILNWQQFYKRINDSLFSLTLLFYPPIRDNLLLVTKCKTTFNDDLFSNNMNGKWDYYSNKLFNSKISIGGSECLYEHDYYFKSIKNMRSSILTLYENRIKYSQNKLIYAHICHDHLDYVPTCELILKRVDNLGVNLNWKVDVN